MGRDDALSRCAAQFQGRGRIDGGMWNKQVDGFDVDRICGSVCLDQGEVPAIHHRAELRALLLPNATYDRIVGITPSKCSRRDLIADLAKALAARNIRLMVYLPSGAPAADVVARQSSAGGGASRAVGNFPASRWAGGWPSSSGTGRPSSANGRSAGARASRAGGSTAATSPTRCTVSTTSRTSPASPGR